MSTPVIDDIISDIDLGEFDDDCECDQFPDTPCQNKADGDSALCRDCQPTCAIAAFFDIPCCGMGERCRLIPLLDGTFVHVSKSKSW